MSQSHTKKGRFSRKDLAELLKSRLSVADFRNTVSQIGQDFQNLSFSLLALVDFLILKGVFTREEMVEFVNKRIEEVKKAAEQQAADAPQPAPAGEKVMVQEFSEGKVTTREATPEEIQAVQNLPTSTVREQQESVNA